MNTHKTQKNKSFVWKQLLVAAAILVSLFAINGNAQTKPVDPNMVFVEGGTFKMGNDKEIPNFNIDDEKPIHSVTVGNFYISKYEITQKEWREVMGEHDSFFKGENLPVEQISWYDAVEFCNRKSVRDGLTPAYSGSGENVSVNLTANGYRLPTEAEWEYAARGGKNSKGFTYSGSSSIGEIAWYGFYSGSGTSGESTSPIGTKKPNELGLFDMTGNVWEYCWDRYGEQYYAQNPSTNPTGPTTGDSRIMRGGAWNDNPELCRVANRDKINPEDKFYFTVGLRLVQSFLK